MYGAGRTGGVGVFSAGKQAGGYAGTDSRWQACRKPEPVVLVQWYTGTKLPGILVWYALQHHADKSEAKSKNMRGETGSQQKGVKRGVHQERQGSKVREKQRQGHYGLLWAGLPRIQFEPVHRRGCVALFLVFCTLDHRVGVL